MMMLSPAAAGQDRAAEIAPYPRGTRVLEGVIVNVISAEEMVLWEKGRLHPFRLYGIGMPAQRSPQGRQAKQTVSDMIFNTLLRVYLVPGSASPPRGIVVIGKTCLNQSLVRMGIARLTGECAIPEICSSWQHPSRQEGNRDAPHPAAP